MQTFPLLLSLINKDPRLVGDAVPTTGGSAFLTPRSLFSAKTSHFKALRAGVAFFLGVSFEDKGGNKQRLNQNAFL